MSERVAQPNIWQDERIIVQRGDLFALGQHRLLCGDSTCAEDVARLFGDKQFSLCFTSPPYSDQRTYTIGQFDWHALMCGAFTQIVAHGQPDCHILINLGLSHKNRQVDMYLLGWLMQCAEMGWPLFGWYVWDKGAGMPGNYDGRLAPAHEFLFHFNRENNKPNKWIETQQSIGPHRGNGICRYTDGALKNEKSLDKFGQAFKIPDSVVRITREKHNTTDHPAVFPVALPEFMMQTWSQSHDIIYEPFCGSGTSIIAGENLKRRVFACEISPEYCELAIQRWQAHTGQKAVRG